MHHSFGVLLSESFRGAREILFMPSESRSQSRTLRVALSESLFPSRGSKQLESRESRWSGSFSRSRSFRVVHRVIPKQSCRSLRVKLSSDALRVFFFRSCHAPRGIFSELCSQSHALRVIISESCFPCHYLRVILSDSRSVSHALRIMLSKSCSLSGGLRVTLSESFSPSLSLARGTPAI